MPKTNPTSKEKCHSALTLSEVNSRTNLTEKIQLDDDSYDDYDPFSSRDHWNGQSTCSSFAHLLKGSLGSGILAMPMAFKNAGLVFGMIGTVIAGFLCTHCVHILVKTSHRACRDAKVPALGYAETAEKVFEYGPKRLQRWSKFAKQFVDCALMMTYFASTSSFIVFIAQTLHDVINYDTGLTWNIRIYIAITIIPLVLFVGQIRSLKVLVPFSSGAIVCIVISFVITLYYIFNVPLVYSDKPFVADLKQIPIFFSTAVFAMEGIGAVMPVENAMKNPQRFLGCFGILNISMCFVVILYATIGFFGYARFGDAILGSITLNLEPGLLLADIAKILMAFAILLTYGLLFYIPNEILWRKIGHKFPENKKNISQILLRTGIIFFSGAIAAAIPNLGPFISLVGAIFYSTLGFFTPSLLETIYLWPNNLGWCKWKLIKNVILMAVSIFVLLAGSFVSLKEIAEMYY